MFVILNGYGSHVDVVVVHLRLSASDRGGREEKQAGVHTDRHAYNRYTTHTCTQLVAIQKFEQINRQILQTQTNFEGHF
jgi:hypothetical protein